MLVEEQMSWVDCVALSSVCLTIAYGDKVIVYITKYHHTMRYDKSISGKVVRLEFPHKEKYHMDSCLRCRDMTLSYCCHTSASKTAVRLDFHHMVKFPCPRLLSYLIVW